MISKVQSQTLFSNAQYGINRVFSLLKEDDSNGLTKSSLTDLSSMTAYDYPFAQLINSNFTTLDTDNDGVISVEELNKMITNMQSKGMTKEQLLSLSAMQGVSGTEESKEMLSTVIENFSQVDTNGDGCVSQNEIDAYMMNKEIDDKKEKLTEVKDTDMTTFYADETETNDAINKALSADDDD
ncbi:MAG: EF-hand domain-containing protein [Vampirovibrionia bacterium]